MNTALQYALPPTPVQKKINYDIEALRGFAALFVVWHHVIVFTKMLDPGYTPSGIWSYYPSGHFSVLIFFVLSGYVIGISNKIPLTWATTGEYLKKRLIRIYPIFLFTLLLTLAVRTLHFDVLTIAGNVALLQGLVAADINPLGWSLNYEVLYYIIFIPLSIFRPKLFVILTLVLVVSFINCALFPTYHTPPILTSYGYGLIFWVTGLSISQLVKNVGTDRIPYQILLGCILFMLCVEQYNLIDTILHKAINRLPLNMAYPEYILWDKKAINLFDLSELPIALLIIFAFIDKRIKYKLLFLRSLVAFSAINLVYVIKHAYQGDLAVNTYALPTLFLAGALLCLFVQNKWLETLGKYTIQIGIWLGSLSYAIYLVHYPILVLFSRISAFSGTSQTFIGRALVFLLVILCLSYVLEKVIQPRIKQFFT